MVNVIMSSTAQIYTLMLSKSIKEVLMGSNYFLQL